MQICLERPMLLTDPQPDLVQRLAAGDENALRELYATYGQRMYAYALRLTSDPACADDVVQDSLVAAWQGAGRFRGESRPIAWLLGIVHHKALNAVRGRPGTALEDASDVADAGPGPDEHVAFQEQRRLLRDGLQHLPLEQRTVLDLVFYQGLSLEETAQVCGCPLGTVKSRLSYAKTALRGALQRAGLAAEDTP